MIEEFIKNLIIAYVPDNVIRAMVQVIFIMGCLSIVMFFISIGMFFMNLASLVDRIFPIRTEEVKKNNNLYPLWMKIRSSKLGTRIFGSTN
jgi:hypothetical protein